MPGTETEPGTKRRKMLLTAALVLLILVLLIVFYYLKIEGFPLIYGDRFK